MLKIHIKRSKSSRSQKRKREEQQKDLVVKGIDSRLTVDLVLSAIYISIDT